MSKVRKGKRMQTHVVAVMPASLQRRRSFDREATDVVGELWPFPFTPAPLSEAPGNDRAAYIVEICDSIRGAIRAAMESGIKSNGKYHVELGPVECVFLGDFTERLPDVVQYLKDSDLNPAGREALRALQLVGHPGERRQPLTERNLKICAYVEKLKKSGSKSTGEGGAFERAGQKYDISPATVKDIYSMSKLNR
jgi:hypothetical protein